MQDNLSFSAPYYKGSGIPNGIPAYIPGDGMFTLGGYQAMTDTGGDAKFGYAVSSNPAGNDGEFWMGIPNGYILRGFVKYDAGVAMNDPAKPDYMLVGVPMTVLYQGALWYYTWNTTLVGAGAPLIGSVIVINNSTGEIEFLPAGTTSSMVPATWTVLSSSEASVKSYDPLLNAGLVYFNV